MGNESSKKGGVPSGGAVTSALGIRSGPSSSTVQKHLENAKKSRILQLKSANLKKLPDVLIELADIIRNLDVSSNKIRELPPFIGQFSQLKQLHLNDNELTSLPDEIGMLKKLEILSLHGNSLTDFPPSIVGCNSLKTITVSSNKLSSFPLVLAHLVNAETINLAGNQIETLPEEISSLSASELNLNQNRLTCLGGLPACQRLKILRVEENCLSKEAFSCEFLESSPVSIIAYIGNLFADKDFQHLPGYEEYQQRFTATRRKM